MTDVAFAEDSSMFVTVGNRHVKFWYLDASKSKVLLIFFYLLIYLHIEKRNTGRETK